MRIPLWNLGRLARVSLLLAVLASLVGGVAGHALHVHGEARTAAVVLSAPEPESGLPLPDGERGCLVCQILGAGGVPALAAGLPEASVRPAAASPPPLQRLSHREPAPSRARAPPLALPL